MQPPPPMQQPPPMQPYSPPPGPVAATAKLSFNQWLRASPWWHKVLVLLPLVVVPIGGLIGGVCGGAMAVANQAILRSALGTAGKVWACVGVMLFGGIVFVVAEVLVAIALGQA